MIDKSYDEQFDADKRASARKRIEEAATRIADLWWDDMVETVYDLDLDEVSNPVIEAAFDMLRERFIQEANLIRVNK